MKALFNFIALVLLCTGCATNDNFTGTENDRKALEQTSIGIRTAFSNGDIPAILSYHHPQVRKALGYRHIINGREELEKDLKSTFSNVKLDWLENKVESLLFQGNTAIEMTAYTIRATPKDGKEPFTFSGRAMIVYVKYNQSPSGWASIRELIQPGE